jgi:hypothetical protein
MEGAQMAVLYLGEHTRTSAGKRNLKAVGATARVPIGRQLAKLMAAPGDIVTVTKLDRLGRSTRAKQIREVRAGNTPIIRHR